MATLLPIIFLMGGPLESPSIIILWVPPLFLHMGGRLCPPLSLPFIVIQWVLPLLLLIMRGHIMGGQSPSLGGSHTIIILGSLHSTILGFPWSPTPSLRQRSFHISLALGLPGIPPLHTRLPPLGSLPNPQPILILQEFWCLLLWPRSLILLLSPLPQLLMIALLPVERVLMELVAVAGVVMVFMEVLVLWLRCLALPLELLLQLNLSPHHLKKRRMLSSQL